MPKHDETIHCILPEMYHWCRSVLFGVSGYIRECTGYYLRVHSIHSAAAELAACKDTPAGLIGAFSASSTELVAILKKRKIPAVCISGADPPKDIYRVNHDDLAVGRIAADYLHSIGLSSFAFVGIHGLHHARLRGEGYVKQLQALGVDQVGIMKAQNDDQFDCWLRSLPKPTGVFAATDNRARHVTSNAEKLGIKVPQELIVLGVDNDPYQCELTRAPLSSIELKYKKMGQLAAKTVCDLIAGKTPKEKLQLVEPGQVVVRLSTDFLANEDLLVREAIQRIRANRSGRITVAELADGLGISRRTLVKRFKHSIGLTVYDAIHKDRMNRARFLVEESSLTIAEIGERIGISDAKRFISLFSKEFGMTPLAHRKELERKHPRNRL